ncbi:glycosyltransferase [Pseudomonas abyssi]|uniref:glycosyltransferase n=1 Tax=Pseudomonas abyssi TaxID=170540 RepID=UPI003C7AB425
MKKAKQNLTQAFDGRSSNEFRSVDSAPKRFAKPVPIYSAPMLLATFVCISSTLLWLVNAYPPLADLFPHEALVLAPARGEYVVPIRIFILSFLLSFGLYAGSNWRQRLLLTLDMSSFYLVICLFTDAVLVALDLLFNVQLHLRVIQAIGGISGFALFAFKLLEWGQMPARVEMEVGKGHQRGPLVLLCVTLVAAVVIADVVVHMFALDVLQVREMALLGGVGPGIFLVFPAFFSLLYLWSRLRSQPATKADYAPDLTVLIPALNEAYIIADVIAAVDRAAERYDGQVSVLLIDNGSTDETVARAQTAFEAATHLHGTIHIETQPGKAKALNHGLALIRTDYFIRIDADTLVWPDALKQAARLMGDPTVGVVGGIPLPPGRGIFDHSRALEVYLRHGFYNVAYQALDALIAIPGMFALYRTELPRQLGGFVFGMNGEDTDMSLRIGELGYQVVVNPKVLYTSEVPVTYRHLREQRLRWFRSTLHISARCRDMLYGPKFSIRGKILLPFTLVNLARRTMILPLILFGLLSYVTHLTRFDALSWQALTATFIGVPALFACFAALINGAPRALLYIPEYLLFRLLRSYFTLESMLSVQFKDQNQLVYTKKALAERGTRPDWQA